ncbi:MAG: hypothetical protein JW741_01945 [Sedimentisphaerales bacterium]|nr:hypothetical protein [Sedimentisphaerales bacterium]
MPGRRKTTSRPSMSKRRLATLVEEATVDCYNESEAVCGFYTMIDEHLEVPFTTVVLGVDVEVVRVELTRREEIVAVCVRGKQHQRIPVCDLPLPSPQPAGAEWIEAYSRWAAGA